jgi:O-antigen/teichoic acid export membrane protein
MATALTYAFGLLSNALVARGLSPSEFGKYVYAVWVSAWLVMIFNNGLTVSVIRFIAEALGAGNEGLARRCHGFLLRKSRLFEACILAGVLAYVALGTALGFKHVEPPILAIVTVAAVIKARYLFKVSVAKGYGQYKIESFSTTLSSVGTVIIVFALYMTGASTIAYLIGFAVSSLFYLLIASTLMRPLSIAPAYEPLDAGERQRIVQHLKWTTFLVTLAIFGNKSVEVFLLNKVGSPEDVAFFAVAAALARGGIDLLSAGMMTILMPVMSSAFGKGGEAEVGRVLGHSVRYLSLAGSFAAGVGVLLAAPAIKLLYGEDYHAAVFPFQAMVLVASLTLSEGAYGAVLSTTDRQRSRTQIVVVQICLTVVLALILVPEYGLRGAVWSHVISRLLGVAYLVWRVEGWFSGPRPPLLIARQLISIVVAAAAAALVLLLGPTPVTMILASVTYGVVFLVASVVARVWSKSELSVIGRVMLRVVPAGMRGRVDVDRVASRWGNRRL